MTSEAPERAIAIPERRITLLPGGVGQAVTDFQEFQHFVSTNMVLGVDYGEAFPGAGGKPSLLKPGAEKLCNYYGLRPEQRRTPNCIERWDIDDPFFQYEIETDLCHIEAGLYIVRGGLGSCNSLETKYRWRNQQRNCPACGSMGTIRKGREDRGGGWFCSRRDNGCGENFPDGSSAIENQPLGKVPNDAIFDIVNTILKMGKKRSLVDATLIATRASGIFTQDIEDAAQNATGSAETGGNGAQGQSRGTSQPRSRRDTPARARPPSGQGRADTTVSTQFWAQVRLTWPNMERSDAQEKANEWCRALFEGKAFPELDAVRAKEALQALIEGYGLADDKDAVLPVSADAEQTAAAAQDAAQSELPAQ